MSAQTFNSESNYNSPHKINNSNYNSKAIYSFRAWTTATCLMNTKSRFRKMMKFCLYTKNLPVYPLTTQISPVSNMPLKFCTTFTSAFSLLVNHQVCVEWLFCPYQNLVLKRQFFPYQYLPLERALVAAIVPSWYERVGHQWRGQWLWR